MRGFTLVEVMISLVVLSVLSGALVIVFSSSKTTYDASTANSDLQSSARQAIEAMTRELRQADLAGVSIANAGDRIEFQIPTDITASPATMSSTIAYYLSGNQLLREHPSGTTNILGNDITQIAFSLSGDQLTVALTAGKTVRQRTYTLPLTEHILIRN